MVFSDPHFAADRQWAMVFSQCASGDRRGEAGLAPVRGGSLGAESQGSTRVWVPGVQVCGYAGFGEGFPGAGGLGRALVNVAAGRREVPETGARAEKQRGQAYRWCGSCPSAL